VIVYHWNRGPPRTAGAGRRAAAFALDASAVFALAWTLSLRSMSLWTVSLVALPLLLVYFTLFEGFGGRTPGKMMLGLRVARLEGGPNDLFHSFLRNLLRLLWATPLAPAFILLDAWVLGRTELDQRLGDLAAGTVVLDERPSTWES
jgi:uncharacterized RDD family membrane protein YckC